MICDWHTQTAMKIVRDHMTGIIAHHHTHSEDSGGKGRVKTLLGKVPGSGMRCKCLHVYYIAFHCCFGCINIDVCKYNTPDCKIKQLFTKSF
jgi:hypothetical protein